MKSFFKDSFEFEETRIVGGDKGSGVIGELEGLVA